MAGQSDKAPIRIGIAGLGFGVDVHLPAFLGIDNVTVTGLLGRDPAAAARVAAKTRLPVTTDLDTWIQGPFDAVSLALPPDQVERVAMAALDRGLPVLAEKPLTGRFERARLLAERAANRPSAIDFEFAELETFIALSDVIRGGTIGTIRHTAVLWLMESRALRDRIWSWKTDAAQHGGALTLLGTHFLHLAEWLLGPMQRLCARLDARVTAQFCPSAASQPADDLVHLIADHRDGAVSSLIAGNANPGVSIHRWTIVGDRGVAILERTNDNVTGIFRLQVFGPEGQLIREVSEPRTSGDDRIPPFQRLAGRFVDAVRLGERCRPDFSHGARVAFLVDTAHDSGKTGSWVNVSEQI